MRQLPPSGHGSQLERSPLFRVRERSPELPETTRPLPHLAMPVSEIHPYDRSPARGQSLPRPHSTVEVIAGIPSHRRKETTAAARRSARGLPQTGFASGSFPSSVAMGFPPLGDRALYHQPLRRSPHGGSRSAPSRDKPLTARLVGRPKGRSFRGAAASGRSTLLALTTSDL